MVQGRNERMKKVHPGTPIPGQIWTMKQQCAYLCTPENLTDKPKKIVNGKCTIAQYKKKQKEKNQANAQERKTANVEKSKKKKKSKKA